uniref:cytochrome P450 84A1-like n=1 Tax=Erigeron canadensis TaxID=72917 RepID=UPI001CB9A8A6|nr:cytochrome P450 84A1-like [Erigeron canadensis]
MDITIISVVSLLCLMILFQIRRKSYPPGPRGWPLIGIMLKMDQLTHRGLAKLAAKYGGLLHFRAGSIHMMVVSSPQVAQEVLKVQDNIFSNRPSTVAIRYLTYGQADMAFAHYGTFWKQMRTLCIMKLFSKKRAESWDSVRFEIDMFIKSISNQTGSEVKLGEMVYELTHDIVYRAAFGSTSSDEKEEFIKIMQDFSHLFGAFNIVDFLPFLKWFDPQGFKTKLPKARDGLDRFIDKIIDEHIQKEKVKDGENDMVDELLAFYDESTPNSSGSQVDSVKLTRNNIKAIIMDVMFGGTETVAGVIEWAMAELFHSPKDLYLIQQELTNVVGLRRQLEESDFEKLIYLKCALKETLRLHPPVPLLFHENANDTKVFGYHVPAKSRIMINLWAIGRDKGSWTDPDTFKPSRFLEEGAPSYKDANFEFIPFGSGRRSCPGMQLGLYTAEMALARLLHSYTWELPSGTKPSELDMSDTFGLAAPRAVRLVAVPTPRLLCPL